MLCTSYGPRAQLDRDFELLFGLAAAGEEVFVHHVGKVTRLALAGDAQAFDVPTTFIALAIAGNGDVLTLHADRERLRS